MGCVYGIPRDSDALSRNIAVIRVDAAVSGRKARHRKTLSRAG